MNPETMNRREYVENHIAALELDTPQGQIDLKKLAIDQVKYYLELGIKRIGLKQFCNVNVPVTFSLKGRCAGMAHCGPRPKVELNPTLLRENAVAFVHRTPGHEAAHILVYWKFGHNVKAHGEEWQKTMWLLGLDNTRCHKFKTNNVPTMLGKVKAGGPTTYTTPHGITRTCSIGKVVEFD